MTKKQFLRGIAFLLTVAVLFTLLCDLFEESNTDNANKRFYKYRKFEDGVVDAVIVGTSGIDRYWIPSVAYEKYGMTVYPLATNSMPVFLYIELIKEALAYQDPELLLIDVRPFTQLNEDIVKMDVKSRDMMDVLYPFSMNRVIAGFKAMKAIHEVDPSKEAFDLSFLLSFIKFHTMWEEDGYRIANHLGSVEHNYLGYYMGNTATIMRTKVTPPRYDPNRKEVLNTMCETMLYEVIDFVKENNINAVFIDTPQDRSYRHMGRANTVYEILDQEGIPYIHFYSKDAKQGITINFDYENDFYNDGHLNYYGATKFTNVLADLLKENYNLPDRRNDESVKKDWDGVQEKLEEKIADLEAGKK